MMGLGNEIVLGLCLTPRVDLEGELAFCIAGLPASLVGEVCVIRGLATTTDLRAGVRIGDLAGTVPGDEELALVTSNDRIPMSSKYEWLERFPLCSGLPCCCYRSRSRRRYISPICECRSSWSVPNRTHWKGTTWLSELPLEKQCEKLLQLQSGDSWDLPSDII